MDGRRPMDARAFVAAQTRRIGWLDVVDPCEAYRTAIK
jgi:hypothetical protein